MTDGMWVDRATLDAWKKERDELSSELATLRSEYMTDRIIFDVAMGERDTALAEMRALICERDALREQLATAMMERDKMKADLLKALQHGMAAIMHAEKVRAEAVPLRPEDRHPCGAWYCKGGWDGCEDCTMDHGRRE